MAKDPFLDAVNEVIGAARAFLDTDAVYGPDAARTRETKERLADAMTALMPSDGDAPTLRVPRDLSKVFKSA